MAAFGGVLLSFKREPDGNSSTLILSNLSYKAFCCLCLLDLPLHSGLGRRCRWRFCRFPLFRVPISLCDGTEREKVLVPLSYVMIIFQNIAGIHVFWTDLPPFIRAVYRRLQYIVSWLSGVITAS